MLGKMFWSLWLRRASLLDDEPSARAFVAWRLRNEWKPARRLAGFLLRSRRVFGAVDELLLGVRGRGFEASRESLLSNFIGASLFLAIVSTFVSGNAVCLAVVPACAVTASIVFAGNLRDRRNEALRASLPVALESMSACFNAGYTLSQTFNQVAKDVPGPVGDLFLSAANVLESGGGAHEALSVIQSRHVADEVSFIAVALDIQHQTGGSIKPVLEAASDSVKGELALKKELRVQTAQARLSARVVTVMPLVLIALFSLASPTFMTPFFGSAVGIGLLTLALVMQVMGVLLVRRALSAGGACK